MKKENVIQFTVIILDIIIVTFAAVYLPINLFGAVAAYLFIGIPAMWEYLDKHDEIETILTTKDDVALTMLDCLLAVVLSGLITVLLPLKAMFKILDTWFKLD